MTALEYYSQAVATFASPWWLPIVAFALAYLVGSIPWAYIIVRAVNGEDVTAHGTGNVGAMNVRRSTGSWMWFVVAMVADALKGMLPVSAVLVLVSAPTAAQLWISPGATPSPSALPYRAIVLPLVVAGCVLGHNYSLWMILIKRRLGRTGKGLATGGGALLAYDWRYFIIVVTVGLLTIAVTKYMLAGQVAGAVALPIGALALHSPDWPFTFVMGALIYSAHHHRFIGLLTGREPKFYVDDAMGPRG